MPGKPLRIAIGGATGRMGRAIARLIPEHGCVLVGACAAGSDVGGHIEGVKVTGNPAEAVENAEVVIDFSHASAVPLIAKACKAHALPLVSGTTNVDEAGQRALEELSRIAPVLWSPNMSLGVELLAGLVERAARTLGVGIDVEIIEAHHNKKVDAPSGTAKRLVEAVRTGIDAEMKLVHGRVGEVGARSRGEIGVHAIRGGDIVGDHTVMLLAQGERIELTHRVTSRDVFAHGALRAARFVTGKPARRYTMKDMLGG